MELNLILRDVPVKDDAVYKALCDLKPRRVIYSVDFGVRSFPKRRNSGDASVNLNHEMLEHKLAALKDVEPLRNASEVSPMFPSYWFSESHHDELLGFAAGEAFRLFGGVKTVYFDLGIHPNIENARAMAERIWKFDPATRIGIIAPTDNLCANIEEYRKFTNAFPCPFVGVSESVVDDLVTASLLLGPDAEAFCSFISFADAQKLEQAMDTLNLAGLVFWSVMAMQNVKIPVKELPQVSEQPKEEVPTETFVEMKALYTSMLRKTRNMDSEMIGHVSVGDKVKIRVYPPNADGTSFGKVDLGDGQFGYVVAKHFKQEKFALIESEKVETNHE